MAMNVAGLAGLMAELFDDQVRSQINRTAPLLQLLPKKMATSKNIQWDAKVGSAGTGAAVIADGTAPSSFVSDTRVPALLNYGTYHGAFSVTPKAIAFARAARNPAELASIFMDEMGDAVERLAVDVAADVYTGSGILDTIAGLTLAVDSTGTYAGVNRATYAQWGSSEIDNTVTGNDLEEDMRDLRTAIYKASALPVDLWVMDPDSFAKYGKRFKVADGRRYVQDIQLRGKKITLDAGYSALEFDGVPVIQDVRCPADTAFALNTRHVTLQQLPDPNDPGNQGQLVATAGEMDEEQGIGASGLTARFIPLAFDGGAYKFALYVYPQLAVRRPNSCGKIINVA